MILAFKISIIDRVVRNKSINSSYSILYLLCIMLQWKSAGGVYLETGPEPAYLIKGKQDGPGSTEADNKSNFDNFDLAWGAGIGFMSRMGLGIGARYNFGLTNTIEDGGGNNSPNNGPELKNSVIQVGLSWRFGTHK